MSTKLVSGWRSIVAAGALTVVGTLAAAPAFADGHGRGDDRWGDHGYRDHGRGEWHRDADRGRGWRSGYRGDEHRWEGGHRWEGRYGYGGPYYRYPPVYRQYYSPGYVVPEYPAAYYSPPDVYYAPPAYYSPGIGLEIHLPLF